MKTTSKKILCFMLISICMVSCGQAQTDANESNGVSLVMTLPEELQLLNPNITATLTVYSTTVTQIYHKAVSPVEDSDGNAIIVSPPLTLKQSTHYRFVIVFYLSSTVYAYVDTVLQVSDQDTTNLAYTSDDIVFGSAAPTTSLSAPSLYKQSSESLVISDVNLSQSKTGKPFVVSSTITSQDSNFNVSLVLSDDNGEFLTKDLSNSVIYSENGGFVNTSIDTDSFPSSNFNFYLLVTDDTGNTSSLKTSVEIDIE